MSTTPGPRLESLETRSLLAAFGFPWTDSRHLTVSFVPDGTPLGPSWTDTEAPWQGAGERERHAPARSELFSTLDKVLPRADWQREVLRALQTWAAETGLELSVVPDSGAPLGTPGAAQGDPRFGDIRVAGAPFSSGAVSLSVPFVPQAGTYAGDLLFNTAAPLGPDYDLFSVALHEAGHILGIEGQVADPDGALFEYYTGPKSSLSPSDLSALHAVSGPRPPDAFEGRSVSFHQAAWETYTAALRAIDEDASPDPDLPHAVDANLSPHDVDSFAYLASGPFTASLNASGRSLLRGKLSVLDARGRVVASASAGDIGGDVELSIQARPGATYTIRVEGAEGSVFGVGEYRLVVKPRCADGGPLARMAQELMARGRRNDALASATALSPMNGGPVTTYAYEGTISRRSDVDYYGITGPGGTQLDVQAWTAGRGITLSVLDARGRLLATTTAGREGAVLHLEGLSPSGRYYLKVSGPRGAYTLGAQVGAPVVTPDLADQGTLSAEDAQQFRGLLLPQSGVVRLEIDLMSAPKGAVVEVGLFGLDGEVAFLALVESGKKAQLNLFLPQGAYTVRLLGASADGSPLQDTPFTVQASVLTDPIGPKLVDPNAPPRPRAVQPEWYNKGFKAVLAVTDPFGRPVKPIAPPPVVLLPPEKVPTPWLVNNAQRSSEA